MCLRAAMVAAAAVSTFALGVGAAPPAHADDVVILVADEDVVTLTAADTGATASLTLENQGTAPLDITVAPGAGAADSCDVTPPDDATLDAGRQQSVTFTFSEACDVERDEGTDFTVVVGEGTPSATTFELHADPPDGPSPDWLFVGLIFLVAGALSVFLLALAWGRWTPPDDYPTSKAFRMPLPGLDAEWTFTDSWASNATVVTALASGLLGATDVTTALLGDDAEELLAIALVAAAFAVGLVGLGPMVLQACRERLGPVPEGAAKDAALIPRDLYVTPTGMLFAALFTLTGTVGQLGALVYALTDTDAGNDLVIIVLGVIAAGLVFAYAYAATTQNLTTGAVLPPPDDQAGGDEARVDLHRRALADGETTLATVVVSSPRPGAKSRRRSAAVL